MADSETSRGEVGGSHPRYQRPKRKRTGCLVWVAVFVALVVFIIVRQFADDPSQSSDAAGTNQPAARNQPAATNQAATTPTAVPQAEYISLDGSELDLEVSLVTLFEEELSTPHAVNRFISILGTRFESSSTGGRRTARWDLPGSASVEVVEGTSISVFCGTENVIAAHVGDGVILCRSTLEEANRQASDGIGVFEFGPNATTDGPGDWIACGSDVIAENATLEFRVNATTIDDAGSSANDAAPTDIINGLKLTICTPE